MQSEINRMKDDFWQIIKGYRYVSFDLYDTLIFRLVNKPEDIFRIIEKQIRKDKCFDDSGSHLNFRTKRIKAEKKARANKTKEDIQLNDIYRNLEASHKNQIKKLEEEIEVKYSYPNSFMIDILERCRATDKVIIITTDMYLERKVIKRILQKNGISYDYLYISGECGKTKLTGNLFDYLMSDIGIKCDEIVHIGDNWINDFERANNRGIKALHYSEKGKSIPYLDEIRFNGGLEEMIAANSLYRNVQYKKIDYEIGFCAVGPMLGEFCKWVHEKKISEAIDKLWFISREGFLIYNIYISMYPEDKKICHYVQLNKNLLRLPFLQIDPSIETFLLTAPSYEEFTIQEIFSLIGRADIGQVDAICTLYHISRNHKFTLEQMRSEKFQKIWREILRLCADEIVGQYDLFKKYMKTIYCLDNKIALVNNSIDGSLQFLLEQYAKRENCQGAFCGLQFIMSAKCIKKKLWTYSWFNEKKVRKDDIAHFNRSVLLFEHMLFEPTGTALRLADNDGDVCVVTDDAGKEVENFSVVEGIQQGAEKYVVQYEKKRQDKMICELFAELYFKFIKNPSLEEVALISNIYDRDIDGEKKLLTKAENVQQGWYKQLKQCRKNEVAWPVGYLKLNGSSENLIRMHNNIILIKCWYKKFKEG